jgi:hypothetical protein
MSTKPISPERLAANRANAANSTGPRTAEGKAHSSQNARKHTFNPEYFAVVRLEAPEALANLVADAVDYYQPADSQERFAVERIALAQQEILRCAALQSGFFTTCLEEATERAGTPLVLRNAEMTRGLDVTVGQNRSYWLAEGFNRRVAKSNNSFVLVLRQQAQAERLYRRAIEEFDRLRARPQAPSIPPADKIKNEPIPNPQPEETKAPVTPEAKSAEPPAAPLPTSTTARNPSTPGRPATDPRSATGTDGRKGAAPPRKAL